MSEYGYYFRALQRQLPVWLLVSVAAAGAAWGALARLGPTYSVHFSYLVSLSERENPAEYTFDGFYALQATDLFTATLAGWITTPELIVAAYRAAELPLPTDDARKVRRNVTAAKTAPQLIEVTVWGQEREAAERLAAALKTVMEKNVSLYQDEGIPALQFNVVATEPWTSIRQPNVALVTASVGVVTLLLLINLQLLWEATFRARRD
jgi:capsular polysaccharide biosynthesis protein